MKDFIKLKDAIEELKWLTEELMKASNTGSLKEDVDLTTYFEKIAL